MLDRFYFIYVFIARHVDGVDRYGEQFSLSSCVLKSVIPWRLFEHRAIASRCYPHQRERQTVTPSRRSEWSNWQSCTLRRQIE
jgi:hypothetical protein